MIINRILIFAFACVSCMFAPSLSAQTRNYTTSTQVANSQNRYIDQRQVSRGKEAKVKNENRQLKEQLKHNQQEYKKLLKNYEKAQKEADQCNSYVATSTYDNSNNSARLQNNSNYYEDDFSYEDEVVYDFPENNIAYSQYTNNSNTNSNAYVPQNNLQEQQVNEIKQLEKTLADRKEAQARQEAQLAELNSKLDALMKTK